MPSLVAIDAHGNDEFVTALVAAWERGDAVLPVDPRLPEPARASLLEAMRPGEDVEPGDALVVATSGTTGSPKGAVLTHAALEAAARAVEHRLALDHDYQWLACLPLAHVGGLGVVVRAVLSGRDLVVHDRFDPAAVERAGRERPTVVSLVAAALRRVDPSVFERVILGGSAPPTGLAPNVHVTYGMTETGGGVVYDGRPLDGVEVRVTAAEELEVRGPMLLRAYRDGADPRDGEGWLRTGDSGGIDERGVVHVRGRIGDMIVTGGENVWPEPVEKVLGCCPGVADVAVAGVADDEWGQVVTALVVPADGRRPPALDELRAAAKQELPAYAAPRRLVLVDAIPRTALGKVARGRLAPLVQQR